MALNIPLDRKFHDHHGEKGDSDQDINKVVPGWLEEWAKGKARRPRRSTTR